MIKDVNKAKTMLECSNYTDENTLNMMAFEINENLKEIERYTENGRIRNVAKEQMKKLSSVYTDGGSIQENLVNDTECNDTSVCNSVRRFIEGNRFDRVVVEEKIKLLSKCSSAESKYLIAFLLMKTSDDYNTCVRASEYILEAYQLEPFNKMYENFYKGLIESIEKRDNRIRQEALERKRLAEEEIRQARERQLAAERRVIEERRARELERIQREKALLNNELSEEEEEKRLKVVVIVMSIVVLFLITMLANSMGW